MDVIMFVPYMDCLFWRQRASLQLQLVNLIHHLSDLVNTPVLEYLPPVVFKYVLPAFFCGSTLQSGQNHRQ